MAPTLSEDEIDDLLYYARTGDLEEFATLRDELCKRENLGPEAFVELIRVAKDEHSGNGVLHMAAANGHDGKLYISTIVLLFQTRATWLIFVVPF